jgi:homoserine O-acetyltransferase
MVLNSINVDVSYSKLNSEYGHDAFLIENGQLNYIISNFLSKARVKDVMSKQVLTLSVNQGIKEAAELMLNENKTHIPVLNDQNQLIGIVTAWDLSKAIANDSDTIDEIMTKDVLTCYEDDSIYDVSSKLKEHNISGLPVIDSDNNVIGIITTAHLSNLIYKD